MLDKQEITSILVVTLILGFVISLVKTLELFLFSLVAIFLVIIVNVLAKKIAGYYLDSEVRIKIWEMSHLGLLHFLYPFKSHPSHKLRKPFLIGAFLPLIIMLLSLGYIKWMGVLMFEAKAKIYRAAKRFNLYKFSEMSECHVSLIAIAGIVANLVLGYSCYLLDFLFFARLNVYFAFFNLIPISNLDGNKIFFGSNRLWGILFAITLILIAFLSVLVD